MEANISHKSTETLWLTDTQFKTIQCFSLLQLLSKSSQKVYSSPLPTTFPPSSSPNTAPPHSPASPSRHSSPFRFIGQAHFSPSVLSLSPSPPCVSPSPLRLNSPHRMGSPQRSLSSMSGRDEVLSLEELFLVGPGSEDPHSEISAVTSEGERSSSGHQIHQER